MKLFLAIGLSAICTLLLSCDTEFRPPLEAGQPANQVPAQPEDTLNTSELPEHSSDEEGDTLVEDSASTALRELEIQQSCLQILEASWQQARQALELLQVEDPDSFEDRYRSAATTLLERCAELSTEEHECLLSADNPISGIGSCHINEHRPAEQRLQFPSLERYHSLLEPATLEPEQSAELLSALVGTWRSELPQYGTSTVWTIDPGGQLHEIIQVNDTPPQERSMSVQIEQQSLLRVETSEDTWQTYFFVLHQDTFYTSSNLLLGAYLAEDEEQLVIRHNRNTILKSPERSLVISERGEIVEAECEWLEEEDGVRRLVVRYSFPLELSREGEPLQEEAHFLLFSGHLVDERLQRFTRD